MDRRTFDEMVQYFFQVVEGMDIRMDDRMTILGIITALKQRHDEDLKVMVRMENVMKGVLNDSLHDAR